MAQQSHHDLVRPLLPLLPVFMIGLRQRLIVAETVVDSPPVWLRMGCAQIVPRKFVRWTPNDRPSVE